MENFRIEQMNENHIKDVFEIEKASFGLQNIETIYSSFASKNLHYFVLLKEERVVGFIEFSQILDESELFDIAIIPEYQGRGLSKMLMDFMIDYLKKLQVKTIFLEVNIINNKAIRLYEKYNFLKYDIRKKYYGENDAVLMKCEI